jgi:ATP-dependent DNA helicase RecQ
MTAAALEILKTVYGYDAFRGPQAEIVGHVIAGNDAFVLMPTGGGKSLCYQIPAIVRPGMGLVVSPLLALMADQVAALREAGVKAAALNSDLPADERRALWRDIHDGSLDLLYVAPETLMRQEVLERLDQVKLSLIAIDEAHCLSQWGHDFRPSYRQLDALVRQFPETPCMALTATADEPTRAEILSHLGIAERDAFIAVPTSATRSRKRTIRAPSSRISSSATKARPASSTACRSARRRKPPHGCAARAATRWPTMPAWTRPTASATSSISSAARPW